MKMLPDDSQKAIEYAYSKKHIDKRIMKALREDSFVEDKVSKGVELLQEWLNQTYYNSKEKRLNNLRQANLELVVRVTFKVVAYCQTEELFTSVVGMLASAFNMNEKLDNIKTASEVLAVLCGTDVYDIIKPDRSESLVVKANFTLPKDLLESIERSYYLPPMLVPPRKYKNVNSSPYLTLDKDCLILGTGNSHTGDLCLEVLNKQNQVELQLNKEFLASCEELPPKDLKLNNFEDMKSYEIGIQNWMNFKAQSREVYAMMIFHGNRFYIPWKIDKRGRMYSLGYHITPQGYSYKKASIELANEETIEVPAEYRTTRTE